MSVDDTNSFVGAKRRRNILGCNNFGDENNEKHYNSVRTNKSGNY